jgi:all-trans-retinol 13,14-reductase
VNNTDYHSYIKSAHSLASRHFDSIIIGSGIGGLSTASFLAQAGQRVLLLEQHSVLGGFTHTFQRNGYTWDVGLHYVGQVHIEGTTLNKVFRYIFQNKLNWEPLDNIYDRAIFGDKVYDFPKGKENFKAKLKEYFSEDKDIRSIDRYFELLEQVQNIGSGYFIEKALPPFLAKFVGPFLRRGTLKFSDQTTLDVLSSIIDNPNLLGVLTAQYGDYGLEPSKSSFFMHATLVNHYMDGAAYPVGGAAKLAEIIVPIIEAAGGAALSHAVVNEILLEKNNAIGVRMQDGETFYAKHIVSDTGIAHTYSHLIPKEIAKQFLLDTPLSKLEPSMAHVGLYVGIKEDTAKLRLPKCNYWIFPNEYDHEKARRQYKDFDSVIPVSFISFSSARDPDAEKRLPGRTVAEVIILIPYPWFDKWKDTKIGQRGEEYERLKENLAQRMLKALFRAAPQLEGKVDFYEVSTPLSTEHFSAHVAGEIYGIAHNPARFRQTSLRPQTPIKNLFLSGQDVMTASIAGGAMGGLLCASVILKKNLLWTVKKYIP